jgi:hypothetical protein
LLKNIIREKGEQNGMAKQLNINLGFTADTSAARA